MCVPDENSVPHSREDMWPHYIFYTDWGRGRILPTLEEIASDLSLWLEQEKVN